MNIKKISFYAAMMMSAALFMGVGCQVKYSMSGASIHPDAKTFTVMYFPNNAALVSPTLSPTFTDELTERLSRQTRLTQSDQGDLFFEGEITQYSMAPVAISGSDNLAEMMRVTIGVKVRFTNALEPQYNFDRNFTAYEDVDSSSGTDIISQESSYIPVIVEKLVDDIFNAAVANW